MPGPSAELRSALDALAGEARVQWPGIPLSNDEFAEAVLQRLDAGEDPLAVLRQLCGGDLWLALACARGHAAAIRAFDERYLARVSSLIRRVDGHGELAPDVIQELRDKLLVPENGRVRIEDYSGRGDLLGWLRVVALRAALK